MSVGSSCSVKDRVRIRGLARGGGDYAITTLHISFAHQFSRKCRKLDISFEDLLPKERGSLDEK